MARFNAPPGWPPAPPGWMPPPGWQPDPSWPPAPLGWQWWLPDPTPAPPSMPAPSNAFGWLLTVGGALLIVGSIMPWATAFGGAFSAAGTTGIGVVTLVLGVLVVVGGLMVALTGQGGWVPTTVVVLAAVALIIVIITIVTGQAEIADEPEGLLEFGPGLWVTLVGAILSLLVAAFAVVQRRRTTR